MAMLALHRRLCAEPAGSANRASQYLSFDGEIEREESVKVDKKSVVIVI